MTPIVQTASAELEHQRKEELKLKARQLGLTWKGNPSVATLYKMVMEALEKKEKFVSEPVKTEEKELPHTEQELDQKEDASVKKIPLKKLEPMYPFTDSKTGRIGLYILTNPKNAIPWNEKGSSFVFVRWVE